MREIWSQVPPDSMTKKDKHDDDDDAVATLKNNSGNIKTSPRLRNRKTTRRKDSETNDAESKRPKLAEDPPDPSEILAGLNETEMNSVIESGGSRGLVDWLLDKGMLRRPEGDDLRLVDSPDDQDGVQWVSKDVRMSPRLNSLFERTPESLGWAMKVVFCWRENKSLAQCQEATGAEVDKIFEWYDKCKEYFSPEAKVVRSK